MGLFSDLSNSINNNTTVQLPSSWTNRSSNGSGNNTTKKKKSWFSGLKPTTRDVMGQISKLYQTDQDKANYIMQNFLAEQQNKASDFYNPYTQPTNKAIGYMQQLGMEDLDINDDWFNRYADLKNYWQENNNNNNAKSPTKKSSAQEWLGYDYNLVMDAEPLTKKAEAERNSLLKEVSYWAQRTDRNMSDDEIFGKIDWSKYPTIQKMRDAKDKGEPLSLNRAVDVSDDMLYATIWSARNPDFSGNIYQAMANSALGKGNVWEYNPEIASKLDPKSDNFAPYSLGCTNLDDAAVYFGVPSFGKNWIAENRDLAFSDNETDRSMYQKVLKAEEKTNKAESEIEALNKWLEPRLKNAKDPDAVLKRIDWSLYPTLAAMDKSIGDHGNEPTGDLLAMTRGVDYRYKDLEKRIQDQCAENKAKEENSGLNKASDVEKSVAESMKEPIEVDAVSGAGFKKEKDKTLQTGANAFGTVLNKVYDFFTDQSKEYEAERDKTLTEAADIVRDIATPAEQAQLDNAPSMTTDTVFNSWKSFQQSGQYRTRNKLMDSMVQLSVGRTGSAEAAGFDIIGAYEQGQRHIQRLTERESELREELGDLVYFGQDPMNDIDTTVTVDGQNIQVKLWYNRETDQFNVAELYNATTNEPITGAYSDESNVSLREAVDAVKNRVIDSRRAIVNANDRELTAEEQKQLDEYKTCQQSLDKAVMTQRQNEGKYNDAKTEMERAGRLRTNVINMLEKAGIDPTRYQDFENSAVVTDALRGFVEYDPTVWESYSPFDLYSQEALNGTGLERIREAASQGDEVNTQNIEQAKWILDYCDRKGIQLPDGLKNNINRYIAKLERDHQDYEYFSLTGRDNFDDGVEKGRKLAEIGIEFDWANYKETGDITQQVLWKILTEDQQQTLLSMLDTYDINDVADQYHTFVNQMDIGNRLYGMQRLKYLLTDYEKEIYYYLLGTQGVESAENYYDFLSDGSYGVLGKRYNEEFAEAADELARQGFRGRRAADVVSMIMAPVSAFNSILYGAEYMIKKINGENVEYNPNNPALAFNTFRKSARESIKEEITKTYGEGTLLTKLATSLQEIVSNRGDSLMNMAAFGWLTAGIGNEMLQEFIGAIPMATSAAFDAMSEAKEKGATDEQCWAIGGVTLLAESATEAISIDNIKNAFKAGQEVTGETVKDFLKNWLTQAGISEAFGESMNDIIENYADEKIMGELSEHADLVRKYKDSGMDDDEAEAAARRDELAGILHTAIISYLSPGLDIVATGYGRYEYYRYQTQNAQQHGANMSLIDVMKADKGIRERVDADYEQMQKALDLPGARQNQGAQEASTQEAGTSVSGENGPTAQEQNQQNAAPDEQQAEQPSTSQEDEAFRERFVSFSTDYTVLENSRNGDQATQTAGIASVLDTGLGDEATDKAKAAAVRIGEVFENPIDALEEIMAGASNTDVSANTIRSAIQYAVLGGDESICHQYVMSDAFKNATAEEKVSMLAQAVEADSLNTDVTLNVNREVENNRLAEAEKSLIADGAMNEAKQAKDKENAAREEVRKAQDELENKQTAEEAAGEAVQAAAEAVQQNPADDNAVQEFNRAATELNQRATETEQYEQHLDNVNADLDAAVNATKHAVSSIMQTVREGAAQLVDKQNQFREEQKAKAQAEAEAKAAQEEAQRIAQEENANAIHADVEGFIDQLNEQGYNLTEEEKQRVRDRFAEMSNAAQLARDETGKMTPEARQNRDKFVRQVSRKFGIQIDTIDTSEGGTKIKANGYFDAENNRIVLDQDATMDDAVYAVLGHELTHVAEKSGTYRALANSILRIAYGEGADYDTAIKNLKKNKGMPTNRLEADIKALKTDVYDKQLKRDNSYEYIAQELVANKMGELLNPQDETKRQDLINRLVADDPSVARRILDTIKSFIKKAVGMKGAWLSNAQKTVDMLEMAITDAQGKQAVEKEMSERYMLQEATPIVEDNDGEPLATELPGGTVSVDTGNRYSLSSFTPEEQQRVRQALLAKKGADGNREFTPQEVDKYLGDALGIAKMIADDRQRLDFVASDNQVFLKPNNDYHFTLDASTLCAKRLLYQGTFDYVQHALPDEVFTPEDLIDLVNIMNEMGYETPCGICYVESRRRWLDTYANEFIEKVQKNEDDYVEKFIQNKFKKSSEEEKAALRERLTGEMPSVDDLTTSDGLEKLRKNDPMMYKAFVTAMNAKGSQNPKVVQLRTEYRGDIGKLSAKDIQKVKDIGGLRIQSFSDFETPHLLDMVQAVLDMSSVGLTSQAYTKVPNFAWVFGDTGIKINLSLIGKGTGLDENGNLVFDNREGIDFDEAMKLRDRYNQNVGTILVGINDEHIIAAMGDPRIDFIIPFHKSGWSAEELRKMPTLNNYNDYTDSQNELLIVGDKKHNVKEIKDLGMKALDNWIVREGDDHPGYQVIDQGNGKYTITYETGYVTESFQKHKERTKESFSNFEPVGANQYWEFDKSGEWNARKYLQMCADAGRIPKFSQFLVDNGDGTFSLPEGKDKRSTAIREGYWKTLIDFKMYENDGYGRTTEDGTMTEVRGSEQTEVTPNINMSEAYRVMNEYQLGRQMPDKENGAKGAFIPMKSNNDVPVAIPAAERYIELIRQKREGIKPTNPDDTLEASPSIDVGSLGQSAFHQGPSDEVNLNARTTFGATEAPAVLGNENNEYVEPAKEQKVMYADDGNKYSLSNLTATDQEYADAVNSGDLQKATDMLMEKLKHSENIIPFNAPNWYGGEHKDIAKMIKTGTPEAVAKAAADMASYVPDNAVLVPMPDHSGKVTDQTDTMILAKVISELTGRPVVAALEGADRESRFAAKSEGRKGASEEELGFYQVADLPEGTIPIFIDNVVGSGVTANAAEQALGGGITLAYAKSIRSKGIEGLKRATITYDSDGNLIPLSQRFDASKRDIRYSLPSDAPYLSAVDHGDMENAQQMVEQYAAQKGYTDEAYHGTTSFGFTEFDMELSQGEIFVAYDKSIAQTYTENAEAREIGNGSKDYYNMFASELADELKNDNMASFKRSRITDAEYVPQEQIREEITDAFSQAIDSLDGLHWAGAATEKESLVDMASKETGMSKERLEACSSLKEMAELLAARVQAGETNPGETQNTLAFILRAGVRANLDGDMAKNIMDILWDIDKYTKYAYSDYYSDGCIRVKTEDNEVGMLSPSTVANMLEYDNRQGLYKFYTRPGKQLVVEADGANWNNISWYSVVEADSDADGYYLDSHSTKTREIAAWAKEHGYDSVRINKVYDQGGYSGTHESAFGDIGIFFNQEDVKSADTVTYDDNGIIPLSERFTDEQKDFRYSLPSDDILDQQINEYLNRGGVLSNPSNLPGNAIPEGGNLPGTPGMRPQRQFGHQTAQNSNALHQEVKDYLYNHSSYTPDSNQAQIDRSIDWVRSRATETDPDGYYAALDEVTSDSFDYRSADGQARMLTVMSMAALRAESGDRNALQDELRLADAFNRQGTDLGRQLQARKIFRLMTPVGRQAVLQKMVDQINEEYGRRGNRTRVALSEGILQDAANARTEEEFDNVRKRAASELAQQMPANWKDKLRGWRMLSMLGNPRTHIRNIVGNALFVPAVGIKNKLGALGEIVTRQDQRTKTLAPFLNKNVRRFAKQDALEMKDVLTGEAKYNENSLVEREQKPFNGLLQAIIDFNGNMLEKEDWTFLKGHYKRALGGWMQANGYTAADMQNNPALLEQGRAYAVQEAQKATYRDFNQLAATLNQVSRGGGVAGFIVDATLPFKKTPANILKRGVEYSPAGIMRSLTVDLYHLKQWNDYQNGKLDTLPTKAINPNEFIDRLCSGLTGTAVLAVGALLGHAGLVTCGLDDDDDKNEKEQGNQEYSFKFTIGGQDFTYTIDWAAPMSMPFFVGAAIQEQLADQEGFDIEQLVNAFGNITEPVFNLSMLDGVNTLFKTSQYDDTNTITQIDAKIGSNYVTSYVPSLLGAIARTVDDTSRKSFVESGKGTGVLGTFRYAMEQVENKIPGRSQKNIPIRDVFGNAQTSSLVERIIENFISPGYISEYKNDPVLKEMDRLYNANVEGSSGMVPEDPKKTISYKSEKYVLSAEQWDLYKAERGKAAYDTLTALIGSEDYQNADDATQVKMIKEAWSYADAVGKKAVIPDYEMKDYGNSPAQTVATNGAVDSYKANMIKALGDGDVETFDTMVEALRERGVEDSEIKSKISDAYCDQYKEAYTAYDWERMMEIAELLDMTGFKFDLNAWEKQVDKKRDSGASQRPVTIASTSGISTGGNADLMWQTMYQNTKGQLYGLGNIDLNHRQVVHNDDGSISTEVSMSFYDDNVGKEVLIPTVINGRIVSEDEAINHYYETGEYLGMFNTWQEADAYAEKLHERQDWFYNR